MNDQERIRLLLGLGIDKYTAMVEDAGYVWIRRYFGLSEDMMDITSKSKAFWQWWINQWEIRDQQYIRKYKLKFSEEPLTGFVKQAALGYYRTIHDTTKIIVVPNNIVIKELGAQIKQRQAEIENQIQIQKPKPMSKIEIYKSFVEREDRNQSILQEIAVLIHKVCGVTLEELKSPVRDKMLVYARHLFFHFAHIKMQHVLSLNDLGRFLNRNHATVLHSKKTASDLLCTDKQFQKLHKELSLYITAQDGIVMNITDKTDTLQMLKNRIIDLNAWLAAHPENPYRTKVQSDIRDLEKEIEAIEADSLINK